jgi:hypothetical protein
MTLSLTASSADHDPQRAFLLHLLLPRPRFRRPCAPRNFLRESAQICTIGKGLLASETGVTITNHNHLDEIGFDP